ncbi:hypothetical protein DXG01_015704 [Tephrocybe rancida]|nr:hypothetical protein DXG01_015704 [Tephrocybe rancida]
MPAAHDIYAEQLSELRRGYPLYYPEPPDDRPMQIGDVGFLRQGAFYCLFNVSRAHDDPVQRFGVPDGYEPLNLGFIRSYDAALEAGPLHSKTVSTLEANVGVPGGALPLDASFHFQCASKRGAILMQETQMKREEAVQTQLLEDYLHRHCQSWYDFAKRNHFALGFGQMMLVTECSKTAAWSSAVYSNSTKEFGISFSIGNAFVPCSAKLSTSAAIERTGSIERRRSAQRPCPARDGSQPPKDHTVFFKAFHLGTRQAYKQSLISLFTRTRNSKTTKSHDKPPGASTPNAGFPGANDSEPCSPSECPVGPAFNQYSIEITPPDLPYFHPASPLLAMMMENTDAQCAIVHDNEWCSPTPEASQLIGEYTQFHFDDCDALMDLVLQPQISPQPFEEELDDVYSSTTAATPAHTPLARSNSEDAIFGTTLRVIPPDVPLVACEMPRALQAEHRPNTGWITPNFLLDDVYPSTTTATPAQIPPPRSNSEIDTSGTTLRHRRSATWITPNFLEVPPAEHSRSTTLETSNFPVLPAEHVRVPKAKDTLSPQKLADPPILSAAKHDPIPGKRHGNRARLRACHQCKTLKLKCEYKANTYLCNQCTDGGHNCETSKMRGPPNREELFDQIRQHSVQIRDLMAELTNHDPPSSSFISTIPTESSSKPNTDMEDWTTRAKQNFDAFCFLFWDGEGVARCPTDDLTRVGPAEADDEYSDKSDYDLKTAGAHFISDDEDLVINKSDCVEGQGVNEGSVRTKSILRRQGSFLDTQGHAVLAHKHRPKECGSSTELKPEENVSGMANATSLWQQCMQSVFPLPANPTHTGFHVAPEELTVSAGFTVDDHTGPSLPSPHPSRIFEDQTPLSDDRYSQRDARDAGTNDQEWQHDTNSGKFLYRHLRGMN